MNKSVNTKNVTLRSTLTRKINKKINKKRFLKNRREFVKKPPANCPVSTVIFRINSDELVFK